jgi:hypothetical protein
MGEQARCLLLPGATLIHVYEADSIFEAGVIRYRLLDFSTLHSEWKDSIVSRTQSSRQQVNARCATGSWDE